MKKFAAILAVLVLVLVLVFTVVACSEKPKFTLYEGDDLLKGATVTASDNGGKVKNLTEKGSSSWTTKVKNAYIEITFNKPTMINTIVMQEPTDSSKLYEIHYMNADDNYEMIYRQDRIDQYRMCTFEDISTTKIKIIFIDFDKKISISNLEAYYYKDGRTDFMTQSYLICDTFDADILNPDFISTLKLMTDVIIVNGGLLTDKGEITYNYGKEKLTSMVAKIKELTGGKTKVHIMVGTYIAAGFNENNKAMVKLVKDHLDTIKESLRKFVEDTDCDGIDYDWEYPQLAWEWDAFDKLLIATKGAINGRQLSVALWPYGVGLSKEARAAIDKVNAMAYDQFDERGDHSSIYNCGLKVIDYFLNCGFSKDQILLGLPFYGRTTDKVVQSDNIKEYGKWGNYMESYDYTKDGKSGNSPVYANSYAAIRDKVALSIAYNIGGIMIWHLHLGETYSYEFSRHKALEFALEQRLQQP